MENSTSNIPSFEVFEQKANEARKLLYTTFVELAKFKEENPYKPMENVNFFAWETNREREISAKSSNCRHYLEYFAKGDFTNCLRILTEGWYSEPQLMDESMKTPVNA